MDAQATLAMGSSKARREALERYGRDVMDNRMSIAATVGDKVADRCAALNLDTYNAHDVARLAQRATLEALEYWAYARGLADDPRG